MLAAHGQDIQTNEGSVIPHDARLVYLSGVAYNRMELYNLACIIWHIKQTRSGLPAMTPGIVNNAVLQFLAVSRKLLFVLGGVDAQCDSDSFGDAAEASIEVFDACGQTWGTPSSMPTARIAPAAAVIDCKLYVVGGGAGGKESHLRVLASLEVFDLVTQAWSSLPPMSTGLCGLAAVAHGSTLVVTGGTTSGDYMVAGVETFNTLEQVWVQHVPMKIARSDHAAVVMLSSVFISGGISGVSQVSSSCEVLHLDGEGEAASPALPNLPDMLCARAGHSAVQHSNKVFVIGGDSQGNKPANPCAEIFDIETFTWTSFQPMSTARTMPIAVALAGEIYLVGGAAENTRDGLECFCEDTQSWLGLPRMSIGRYSHACVGYHGHIINRSSPPSSLVYSAAATVKEPGAWPDPEPTCHL